MSDKPSTEQAYEPAVGNDSHGPLGSVESERGAAEGNALFVSNRARDRAGERLGGRETAPKHQGCDECPDRSVAHQRSPMRGDLRSSGPSPPVVLSGTFRHYIGVTYVAVDASRILGFATLAPRHIDIEGLPERVRGDCRGPLPALGLARLAVDRSAQNSGVGSQLLRLVLGLASKMAVEVDCAGVVVAAKPGVVEFYAKYGFVAFKPIEGQSEARPQPTAMWLPIQVIKKAGAPR